MPERRLGNPRNYRAMYPGGEGLRSIDPEPGFTRQSLVPGGFSDLSGQLSHGDVQYDMSKLGTGMADQAAPLSVGPYQPEGVPGQETTDREKAEALRMFFLSMMSGLRGGR